MTAKREHKPFQCLLHSMQVLLAVRWGWAERGRGRGRRRTNEEWVRETEIEVRRDGEGGRQK